jgi:hypothetical protein
MSAQPGSEILQKLRSEELRRHAVDETTVPEVVLVEVDLPRPSLRTIPKSSNGGSVRRHIVSVETPENEDGEAKKRIAGVASFLSQVTGVQPHYLSSSHVFIVEANGQQLRTMATFPLIAAIWPNRKV